MNSPGRGGVTPIETALLFALALVAGTALFVDLVGAVAGALFRGEWASLPLAEMPAVLMRLPSSLADPRSAWPAGIRDDLPGPWGFAAATCLSILPVMALGLVAVRVRAGGSRRRTDAARWASRKDLSALRVARPGGGRVVLGHAGRALVAAEARQSVLVVAPTQTGKTTGLAIPSILEWDGPVLATSVKSDLVRDTMRQRARVGDVRIFDPADATGLERAHWTPLAQCRDWQAARRTADRLAKASQSTFRSAQDAEFWAQAGARFLAPLLMAAALTDRGMADVVRWIDAEEHDEVLDALDAPEHKPALNAVLAVWGADDRLRSSLYLTSSLALEAYNDPSVLACAERAELNADWLLDGSANAAYLCAPIDEQARLRPLFATLVREIVTEIYHRSSRTGRPIDRPLLLVLDEAANIAPLPDLDQIAATGAGQGLQLVSVFQDLAQVHQRWGSRADTIVNNHRAKLFGGGVSCARTLEYLRRVLGDAELDQESRTSAGEGRRSTTRSTTFRPLAPPNALRERSDGSMLLVYGNLPPAVVRTRPWFRDRALRRLVEGPA